MAMIRCTIHGLKGCASICADIRDAILYSACLRHNNVFMDSFNFSAQLCDACKARWVALKNEDDQELFLVELKMVCAECFNTWELSVNCK